jgi:predicted porin
MRVILVKKTLLVSAVAAAMAVSGSAYAAASDGLYGKIRLSLQTTDELTNSTDELDVASRKLVIGYKGSEDLGNGLTASYGIELEHDDADEEQPGWTNDKSWVALAGGFGKVIIGEHSDMAWWACSGTDLFNRGTADACSSVHNTSPANAIQYRGGAGAINFGVAYVADGSGENPTLVGLQWDGGNFKIGAQFVTAGDTGPMGGVPAGESGSAIGGTYAFGDIIIGVTIADSGAATDEAATDIGLQLPLGGGNLAFLVSTMDAPDTDSFDIMWTKGIGGGAYWGVEFNQTDDLSIQTDDVTSAFLGMNF